MWYAEILLNKSRNIKEWENLDPTILRRIQCKRYFHVTKYNHDGYCWRRHSRNSMYSGKFQSNAATQITFDLHHKMYNMKWIRMRIFSYPFERHAVSHFVWLCHLFALLGNIGDRIHTEETPAPNTYINLLRSAFKSKDNFWEERNTANLNCTLLECIHDRSHHYFLTDGCSKKRRQT